MDIWALFLLFGKVHLAWTLAEVLLGAHSSFAQALPLLKQESQDLNELICRVQKVYVERVLFACSVPYGGRSKEHPPKGGQ